MSAMIPEEARARRLFACLGDPSRFRVVARLQSGECSVSDLAREIGLSQSCTTRHLQALTREGLVRGNRVGKRVIFRLSADEPFVSTLVRWAVSSPTPVAVPEASPARGGKGAGSGETTGAAKVAKVRTESVTRGGERRAGREPNTQEHSVSPEEPGELGDLVSPTEDAPAASDSGDSPAQSPSGGDSERRSNDLEDFLL